MAVEHSGGCVCGAARFRTAGEPLRVTVCHCTWCQKRTGTAFGTEVVFDIDKVDMQGSEIGRYRHISDESGRWIDMEFCRRCGSNLGIYLEAAPGIRTIPAGVFDDPSWIRADSLKVRHVYVRSRREWSDLSPLVETYEQHFRK
jgi:hypothetical protein